MCAIYANIGVVSGVNVGIYGIHGVSGLGISGFRVLFRVTFSGPSLGIRPFLNPGPRHPVSNHHLKGYVDPKGI